MASWLIDSRGIDNKAKNASLPYAYQIKYSGANAANRECPNCKHLIDNSDVSQDWPGLLAGVKFEPSDPELVDHLAAKCGVGNLKPHLYLDTFIPTIEKVEGIYYTHPQNLPGAKKDGSSIHFFHRTANAYGTGQRKRRKIQSEPGLTMEQVRWHKTGKTKPVIKNGVQRGCKKIMVLYRISKEGTKPDKTNWVMHQYHLGAEEDEHDGDYVVSKIFYQQPKHTNKIDDTLIVKGSEIITSRTSPRTPQILNLPRRVDTALCDEVYEDNEVQSSAKFDLAGESQAAEYPYPDGVDDNLLCKELFYSNTDLGQNGSSFTTFTPNVNDAVGSNNIPCGIDDLLNLELDMPPDFQLADLQFLSQE